MVCAISFHMSGAMMQFAQGYKVSLELASPREAKDLMDAPYVR